MLVAAAASAGGACRLPRCGVEGRIAHAGRQGERFGALADKAARQSPPTEPKLKDPKDFVLIDATCPSWTPWPKPPARRSSRWTSWPTTCSSRWSPSRSFRHYGKSFDDTRRAIERRRRPTGAAERRGLCRHHIRGVERATRSPSNGTWPRPSGHPARSTDFYAGRLMERGWRRRTGDVPDGNHGRRYPGCSKRRSCSISRPRPDGAARCGLHLRDDGMLKHLFRNCSCF